MIFQSPRGMRDIFGEDLRYFKKIENVCKGVADFYGFERIETPILEQSALFEKGTGVSTDVVQKQMFTLRTKGGDYLTLRPEATPSIIRAYLEHGMENRPKPVKFWYFGPMFRYERPQAGRYRQFYQFGFEAIGSDSWIIDAQIIQIFYDILEKLGFKNLIVEMNSIGDSQCRPYYRKALTTYLKKHRNSLCPDCQRRLKINPLRVLDCKEEGCQKIVREGAPQSLNYLCEDCHKHFKALLETMEVLGLPYFLNPYLVRGLDYYTRTVFEISQKTEEGKSQGSMVGGGRYDTLVKLLGGKDTPACGAAAGVERIINLMKTKRRNKGIKTAKGASSGIFLVQIGKSAKSRALRLSEEFRKENVPIEESLSKDSLSLQLKLADKLKVRYVLILGQKEVLEGKIIVRDMKSGRQKTTLLKNIVKEMKRKIKR